MIFENILRITLKMMWSMPVCLQTALAKLTEACNLFVKPESELNL